MKSQEQAVCPNFQQIFRESLRTGCCTGWQHDTCACVATKMHHTCPLEKTVAFFDYKHHLVTVILHVILMHHADNSGRQCLLCRILCPETFAQLRTARNILRSQAIMSHSSIGPHWSARQVNYDATSTGTPGRKQASIRAKSLHTAHGWR